MNFDGYEKEEALYAEFADTVRLILEKAIAAKEGIPRPQSIQCRAKSAASLKPKLEARGLLNSESKKKEIRDHAGARLIFSTKKNFDKFFSSRLIPDNFRLTAMQRESITRLKKMKVANIRPFTTRSQ